MNRLLLFTLAALCMTLTGCDKGKGDDGEQTPVDGFEITGVMYGLDVDDADDKLAILGDLPKTEPFPEGSYFFIDPFLTSGSRLPEAGAGGQWTVYDGDGDELSDEAYAVESNEREFPYSYPDYFFDVLPINKSFFNHITYSVGDNGVVYHMFVIQRGGETGNSGPLHVYISIYEDLTEYYRAEYPDSGVNAVVRAYVIDPWSE